MPRADIAVSVAIVYSWWQSKDLSIKILIDYSVYSNNHRKR